MNHLHTHRAPGAAPAATAGSLESSDDFDIIAAPRYCPTGLLQAFALLMAGRGRCVNTDMMLGDREYAMWQLACARATDDAELVTLAARLFFYFDDPLHSEIPVLGTA
ncbi:hypothetical protein WG902_11730 [Ramlibacter sp. PS3R-8]|uniref:hypothetical protein n=1 Tax=Ramlibacter sp. PS3R-8 TaxID=3133437 RepID=UPI0030B6ED8E